MRSQIIIHPEEISVKWIDRIADSGITVMGIHPRGGEIAASELESLIDRMKKDEYRELIDYAAKRGLEIEYELHAAGYLMPRALFASHPEYFRMNENGERVSDWNFCISNPEALELFSNRAAELATALYGSNNNFYFWMDDGRNIHCQCPNCRGISASDQQLIAINTMLKKIKRRIPNARMAYLAYIDSILLPETVKPENGVFLEYAPFEKYTAKSENAKELIERELNMLVPLMSFFGQEGAKVLEYWYDNSLFSNWKKPPKRFDPDREALKKDIPEYKKMGFEYISTFGCFLGDDYEKLYGEADITPFAELVK